MFVSNLTRMPPKDSVNLDINHEVNKWDGKSFSSGRMVKKRGIKKYLDRFTPLPATSRISA